MGWRGEASSIFLVDKLAQRQPTPVGLQWYGLVCGLTPLVEVIVDVCLAVPLVLVTLGVALQY